MYLRAFDRLVHALPDACRKIYGDRLQALAVFGSVARNTPRPDSDIDDLLVVDNLPAGRRAGMDEFERVDTLFEPALASARAHGVNTIVSPVLSAPRAGLRPARPPRGSSRLGAARRRLERTPTELGAGSLLYVDMFDQARILVDDNGLLRRFLEALDARLAAQGARRVRNGGNFYWELAPNFRWGDRIELRGPTN